MNNDIKITFEERIKDLRIENGYTTDELAEVLKAKKMYISHTSLNRYENGKAEPSITNAMMLADFYNVPIEYLTGRTNSRKKDISHISISAKLGLKDKAISRLESINRDYFQNYKLDLINYLLESPIFTNVLLEQFMNCCKQKSTNTIQNIEASEFGISRTLIEIIDNYYQKIYKLKISKGNNLFEKLEKINKKNKKKK